MKKWYGVKTLYITSASGKVKPASENRYNKYPKSTLIEERVVLFEARSQIEAIRMAENEAKDYANSTYINPIGQKVKTKYLELCESFELFDSPESGVEVFSSTEIFKERPKKIDIVNMKFGKDHGRQEELLRIRFLDADLVKHKE